MRAAAVALVLIVGAAIVLWYGNTLNSWVLGGLIGGLAAILLSIPISLTLFSYLARRHEEQLQAEEQEESLYAQEEDQYPAFQAPAEVYESDAYLLPQIIERDPRTTGRNLPAMPAARQNQHLLSTEIQQRRHQARDYPAEPLRQNRPPTAAPREGMQQSPVRRSAAAKSARYPGFPGYQGSSQRGYHQTMALRAARLEAMQNSADDVSFEANGTSKRLPAVRSNQSVAKVSQTSRHVQAQQRTANHYRPKPTVEGSSVPPGANRALPRAGESSHSRPSGTINKHSLEPQTDQIGTHYPHTTGHLRRPPQTGQTSATRNPQVESQPRNPDLITGSLKNPMVRRAPYMYEDDPLREELAQQIDPRGIQRRSSRYLDYDQEEE